MKADKMIIGRWYKMVNWKGYITEDWYVKFNGSKNSVSGDYINKNKLYIDGTFYDTYDWSDDFNINEIRHLLPKEDLVKYAYYEIY